MKDASTMLNAQSPTTAGTLLDKTLVKSGNLRTLLLASAYLSTLKITRRSLDGSTLLATHTFKT